MFVQWGQIMQNKNAYVFSIRALCVTLLALITQLLYNVLVQAQHSYRFDCIACSVHLR